MSSSVFQQKRRARTKSKTLPHVLVDESKASSKFFFTIPRQVLLLFVIITICFLPPVVHAVDRYAVTRYFDPGEQYCRLNRYQEAGVFLKRFLELRQNDSESSFLLFQKPEVLLPTKRVMDAKERPPVTSVWEISNNRVILLRGDRNRDGQIDYWRRYSDGALVEIAYDTVAREQLSYFWE